MSEVEDKIVVPADKKEISKKYIVSLGIRPQYFQLRILRTRPYAIFPV